MLRGAIRGRLRVCPPELKTKVRAGRQRDDDDRGPGKPACDWEDPAARAALVDALVRDAYRAPLPCAVSGWMSGWLRRRNWRPSPAKTSRRPPTGAFSSSTGPRPTG